ncbi:DUF2007 domain-containing protein [Lacibacterium aquatile]|uniref:DUF2007 domain-containing protein n=1 Tax=Lacibacterium aquatile TaxID=1168082 RepID=A0ABW5DV96_9PROT
MHTVLTTNDPVKLSYAQALLTDSGIESVVADGFTSVVEGSLGILPRRLMVLHEDGEAALGLLRDAGIVTP